jgi:hypothetical protein
LKLIYKCYLYYKRVFPTKNEQKGISYLERERERGGEAGGRAGGRAGLQAGIFRVRLGLGKI